MVKNPPAKQETGVQSLGQEAPLEEEMASHSSIFAWEIPWTEEPDGLQSMRSQRIRHDLVTKPPHIYGSRGILSLDSDSVLHILKHRRMLSI